MKKYDKSIEFRGKNVKHFNSKTVKNTLSIYNDGICNVILDSLIDRLPEKNTRMHPKNKILKMDLLPLLDLMINTSTNTK